MGNTHPFACCINRLKDFETKLTVIAEQQGQDVNVFRALVKENGKINETKKVSEYNFAYDLIYLNVEPFSEHHHLNYYNTANGRSNCIARFTTQRDSN